MEVLLGKVTQQAMNYAIRTGITITSTYALRQCGRLMKTVEGQEKEELAALQRRLESKIRILSPAIDMIELIAARGNTSLESAVTLTKSLRYDIQALGVRLSKAVGEEQLARRGSSRSKSRAQNDLELKLIIADIKKLLNRIEDEVDFINLAITTSGVNLSTNLPATVSPSRLLQASTFLTAGDSQYCSSTPRAQQIGPAFTLSMYMLFSGHAYRPQDEEGIRETTWKEVMHKARVTLLRVPLDNVYDYPAPFTGDDRHSGEGNHGHIPSESKLHEFAYQLLVVEDLDDDRVHTFEADEAQPGPYEGVDLAGIREIIPIHEISKIFYADTGKILNIGADGETNNPILLLKRDVNAIPPRRMMERNAISQDYESDSTDTVGDSESADEQSELDEQFRRESSVHLPEEVPEDNETQTHPWRLPPNLDLEWMAFEVYVEEPPSESEFEESELDPLSPSGPSTPQQDSPVSPSLTDRFSNINLRPTTPSTPTPPNSQLVPSPQKKRIPASHQSPYQTSALPAIKTSLSLLEMLIRLTALQQFQQSSHLAIPDELLTFFLSDSSTVGAGGDSELRRRVRREARMRVGFDPYDESPIKRRGEDYLEHEFHDGDHDYDDRSPGEGKAFDYQGFPHGSTRSRSATPLRSSPYRQSSPITGPRSKSSADVPLPSREGRASLANVSSASPLLRRATTQPSHGLGLQQPKFRGPPTAPPTSSSPRLNAHPSAQQLGRGSQIPETPPSSAGKRL
ncbi:Ran-binding-domain-containing protein [Aaosphaeria arxii CBS 175.79]|uniref:Ran-binding-domain-containing protein n=1 Tax=Aaosphaeria arxii CBS 175.79 TaxID=1450172 RepID=A0A6A5X9F1_9PLEO|nr:Ran-binding-domain-containing protein [Aaosphaeria arxii CBS 175.79]KAF2009374.1 Ran-binding-domain-containing protein [Aaosphaeria arxii CBS 175.79]